MCLERRARRGIRNTVSRRDRALRFRSVCGPRGVRNSVFSSATARVVDARRVDIEASPLDARKHHYSGS